MRSWYTRILLALILFALVANLATGGEITAEGKWQWILAVGGALFGIVVHIMGIRYVTLIRRKRERSSLLWARRGFIVGLLLVLLVAVDTFLGEADARVIKVMWQGGALLFFLSAAPFFFLLAFQRDASRLVARTGSSGRRRRNSSGVASSGVSASE